MLQHQQQTAQPLSSEEQKFVITVNTESDDALEKLLGNFDDVLS
ncbi:MAG: hypothetical protein WAW61_07725 [Methylococcaceae bacterium]